MMVGGCRLRCTGRRREQNRLQERRRRKAAPLSVEFEISRVSCRGGLCLSILALVFQLVGDQLRVEKVRADIIFLRAVSLAL